MGKFYILSERGDYFQRLNEDLTVAFTSNAEKAKVFVNKEGAYVMTDIFRKIGFTGKFTIEEREG